MVYKYLNKNPKVGDIVEFKTDNNHPDLTAGKLYIVSKADNTGFDVIRDNKSTGWFTTGMGANKFNLIKTKPGKEAKAGDTVIRYRDGTNTCPTGTVFKVLKICDTYGNLYYSEKLIAHYYKCKVLVEETVEDIITDEYTVGSSWKNNIDVATITKITSTDIHYSSEVSKHHMNIKSFKGIYNTKITPRKKQMKPLLKVEDVIDVSKEWSIYNNAILTINKVDNNFYYYNNGTAMDYNPINNTDEYIHNGTIITSSNLRNEVTLSTTQHKETTMVTPQTVEIKVNGKDILCQKHKSAPYLKPKTDFEARKQYTMVVYGVDGEYLNTKYYKTEKQAKKARKRYLNLPEYLGQTVTLHKEYCKPMTTSVPLIEI